jgi:hypothetical protein
MPCVSSGKRRFVFDFAASGRRPARFFSSGAIFLFFLRRKKGGRHHRKIIPAEFVQIDLRESTPAR